MKTNKIIQSSKYYALNDQLKPGIQIQNFFRVDHNSKFQQNPLKINNKNIIAKKQSSHHYEIIYSPRSKSKEKDSDNSYVNKPKIIINNLPPEFNINTNVNNNFTNNNNENSINKNYILRNGNDKIINNFLLGAKTDIKNRDNSDHCLKNIHDNRLSYTTNYNSSKNEINNNSNSTINNNNNHFNTEGSDLENCQNLSSIGFKSFNNISIKNRGKTILNYNKCEFYKGNLSEITEIINKKKRYSSKKKQQRK